MEKKNGDQSHSFIFVSQRKNNLIDTFWRPHFCIWRLKQLISDPEFKFRYDNVLSWLNNFKLPDSAS